MRALNRPGRAMDQTRRNMIFETAKNIVLVGGGFVIGGYTVNNINRERERAPERIIWDVGHRIADLLSELKDEHISNERRQEINDEARVILAAMHHILHEDNAHIGYVMQRAELKAKYHDLMATLHPTVKPVLDEMRDDWQDHDILTNKIFMLRNQAHEVYRRSRTSLLPKKRPRKETQPQQENVVPQREGVAPQPEAAPPPQGNPRRKFPRNSKYFTRGTARKDERILA